LVALLQALAVAEHLNFRRAAAALSVSQSSVSLRVKQLEEYLGILLFERRHRGVRLTEAGRHFLEQVAVGIEHLDYAVKTAGMFESGSILVYLAEKFRALLPPEQPARAECLSWLFWQMGSAPYLGGGFGHFYAYAPTKIEYAIDRFAMEVKRQLDVLDRRLAENEFLGGADYTIADIAVCPWYGGLAKGWLYGAGEFLSVQDYKNLQRWADTILARPAVKRGRMVNRTSGELSEQLHERHDADDFNTKTQDKLAQGPS
jgi:GST-like protein